MLGAIRPPPRAQVKSVEDNAEKIRGDETDLGCSEADDTKDDAIDARKHPSLPIPSTDKNG